MPNPVGTGGEHRLQRIPGQDGLGGRAHAACGVSAADPPLQFLDSGIVRGIGDIAHLVSFGEHRESVHHVG
jgi:hypothetical protein